MTTTTSRRGYPTRAAALALAACLLGAAACGTETAYDDGSPAAPAPRAQSAPHTPMSADAAERRGAAEHRAVREAQQRYLRHLRRAAEQSHQLKLRRSREHTLSHHAVPGS